MTKDVDITEPYFSITIPVNCKKIGLFSDCALANASSPQGTDCGPYFYSKTRILKGSERDIVQINDDKAGGLKKCNCGGLEAY